MLNNYLDLVSKLVTLTEPSYYYFVVYLPYVYM